MATVIVVDDNEADRRLMAVLLEQAGHRVVLAGDGQVALELVRKERPHLLISDLILPSLDGYELVDAIRRDASVAATPIVLQTAHFLDGEVRRVAGSMGVRHVLIKPTEPQAFLDAVKDALAVGQEAPPVNGAKVQAQNFYTEHLRLLSAKLYEEVQKLEAAREELRLAEHNYRLLFDNHPEPMWVYDEETLLFVEANEAAVRRYGYSRAEFQGMSLERVIAPDSLPAPEATMSRTDALRRSGPWVHLAKDGTKIEVEVISHAVTFNNRAARLVMAQDVTEKRRLEELLRQSQRLDAVGQLAGGVAHDFNNLLGVILNFALFVKEKVEAEAHQADGERWQPVLKDVERIERAGQSAARLTHQLLAFARRDVVQPRALNINSVVSELEPLLRRTLGEHVEFVTNLGTDLWPVLIDPGQLEQVLTNLAVNARDAMGQGGRLTVDTQNTVVDETYAAGRPGLKPGRYVRLGVSDSGTGMDAETLRRAFEPFFTTKPKGESAGLGLSNLYGIVTQAGGHVAINSEPGIGTRVITLLPATNQVPPPPPQAGPAEGTAAGGTILVVEDADDVREVVERILTRNGYQVMVAPNGREALEAVRRHAGDIDLVLTDVVMPFMQGKELAERIVALRPGIRVLFMSGYAQPAFGASGTLEPGVVLLEKPFTEPALLARVRQVLEARE
ncbi:hybrid sensor histidine kinase/response regulator [bacterium]|nr:MAG: hybrid sensor histidine kinase/response regulator [bacterium]